MNWISVHDKLPHEQWIEKMTLLNPNVDWAADCDNVLFHCLANFADVNYGHVNDCDIGVLLYTKRDGWMRTYYEKLDEDDLLHLTHWMSFPDPVADKDAQIVYDISIKK
jgi:hypothetical protein